MANHLLAITRFFVDTFGAVRIADSQPYATPRFDTLPTCTERLEGIEGWVRGSAGVASTKSICVQLADDTYAWRTLAPRLRVPFVVYNGDSAGLVWTNQPATGQELFNSTNWRQRADLTGLTQFRLSAHVFTAGAAGAFFLMQYSLDNGGVWASANTAQADQLSLANTGWITGAWVDLVAAARVDVLLRIVGAGGDAAADPLITGIAMEAR